MLPKELDDFPIDLQGSPSAVCCFQPIAKEKGEFIFDKMFWLCKEKSVVKRRQEKSKEI